MTRERLLAGGVALFAERGLHAVTSHDIAEQAGVAAGTFYLHFKDKHALFREIVFEAVRVLQSRLEAAAGQAHGAQDRMRRRAEELLSFAEERRDLVRILFNGPVPALGAEVLDHLTPWVEDDLRAHGLAARVEIPVASQAIVGMWARVLTWWADDPERADREAVLATLIRFQLSGD